MTGARSRPADRSAGVSHAYGGDLRFSSDATPGVSRRRVGRGFRYLDPDGRPIADRAILARIRALAIPPAWTEVWICADPCGHLQAAGRDAMGRKQPATTEWRTRRDELKSGRGRREELAPIRLLEKLDAPRD